MDRRKYRVVLDRGGYNSGVADRFAVEVYAPRPGYFPWRVVETGFGSFKAAAARAAELRAAGAE